MIVKRRDSSMMRFPKWVCCLLRILGRRQCWWMVEVYKWYMWGLELCWLSREKWKWLFWCFKLGTVYPPITLHQQNCCYSIKSVSEKLFSHQMLLSQACTYTVYDMLFMMSLVVQKTLSITRITYVRKFGTGWQAHDTVFCVVIKIFVLKIC